MFCGGKLGFSGSSGEEWHSVNKNDVRSGGHFFVDILDGRWYLYIVSDDRHWYLVGCFPFQGTNIWNIYFFGNGDVFNNDLVVV